jgi:protein TonB
MKHLTTIVLLCMGVSFTYGQALTEKKFYDSTHRITDSAHAHSYSITRYTDSTKKAGNIKTWSADGRLESDISYSNIAKGERNGQEINYHKNGQLKSQIRNNQGKLDGEVTTYYATGQLKRKDTYKNDSLLAGNCFTLAGKDTTWFPYITNAQYEGGNQAIMKFIRSKIVYPKRAWENGLAGKVIIAFFVDEEGVVYNERIISNTEPLLNEEALRVFRLLPSKWKPALLDGEPVKSRYVLPIYFIPD